MTSPSIFHPIIVLSHAILDTVARSALGSQPIGRAISLMSWFPFRRRFL